MLQRQLNRMDYSSGGVSRIDIPREHWHKEFLLKFVGQCDSGSSVARSNYNPFEIVSRIELVANGSQTIKSLSGKMLYLNNIMEHGSVPDRTQTPSSTSQTNQAFGGALSLYLDKNKDYIESLLPSHVLTSLSLVITWGTATDIDTGTSFNIDHLYCYPLLTEEQNVGQPSEGIGILKEIEYTKTLSASGWVELELPLGNVYNSLSLLARDNSAPSNTIIDEFEIVMDGIEVVRKVRFDQSRAEDLKEYSLEVANQPTGFTIVDFDKGGSAPINTKGRSSMKVRFHVSTTPTSVADVIVVAEELVLPR
ncbi:MAG: hypothetical protein KC550_01995 [Nanoarchaeota archaeon]|nr:hypothetical protein [Nanoarchaeota archaeon]